MHGDSLLMLTTKVVSNKKPPLLSDSESGGSTSLKYINQQSIYRAKNLEEFIAYHVKQGKLSEKELKDLCIAYKFKEIKDLPDIKKRQIINNHLKNLKTNSIKR